LITVAAATLTGTALVLQSVEAMPAFDDFEKFLARPGPWLAGFDLPFGLPRELVHALGWPLQWDELMRHISGQSRAGFAAALDGIRVQRPYGNRYIARRGDLRAGSSSPMKLVNPPVGLMLFEGATRLWRSGVSVVPCRPTLDPRVALETYPGYLARQLTRSSYKKDGPEGRSPARQAARAQIAQSLEQGATTTGGVALTWSSQLRDRCVDDGSGDCLDAVICAMQAAMALRSLEAGDPRYGIPPVADPLEGWIATVPAS